MHIEGLYHYPVKGLSAQAIEAADLEIGGAIPWDRAFALAQGDAPFDPAAPEFLPKRHFMCLMANAGIAKLRSTFDPATGWWQVQADDGREAAACLTDPAGRARMGRFLGAFLGGEARGTPVLHHVPGHVFGDQRQPVVSLFNLGSLAAYEADTGAVRDQRRFRANILFTAPAWSEFHWIGRELAVGGARLRVIKRTVRCAATEVNPDTAVRDARPMAELRALYGHADLGVHAQVVGPGRIAAGDAITLL